MTSVMCMRNISILLKMSPQKLIFPSTWVVFCALPAHQLFVNTAGCLWWHPPCPPSSCLLLPVVFPTRNSCQFNRKPKILPKLPGEARPEGLDRN